MSMTATFVQVESADLPRLQADPSSVEALFASSGPSTAALLNASKAMQDRIRAAGPQLLAGALSRLDPKIRAQLEERLGRSTSAFAAGQGGDALLKMMQERAAKGGPQHATLSLDKNWHGVHYLLSGTAEPGNALLSQAVMGGTEFEDEEEDGFSGYGPARYFTSAQVAQLSGELNRPELETEARARFNPERMTELAIYPGWQRSDEESLVEAFRSLRGFYSDAAAKGRAIVTCLV